MGSLFADGVLAPAIVLGIFGFVVPRVFARVLPEGVRPLLLNAFLSTLVLCVIATVLFFGLYLMQGMTIEQLSAQGWAVAIAGFARLGLAAALIWLPILILSVSGLPRHWVHATW